MNGSGPGDHPAAYIWGRMEVNPATPLASSSQYRHLNGLMEESHKASHSLIVLGQMAFNAAPLFTKSYLDSSQPWFAS